MDETVYGIDFTSETDANIIFTGSNGDNNGNYGDDTVVLGRGDDNVTLRLGNDTITAGAGDDVIDGGAGIDTAIFSGNQSDYSISTSVSGLFETITISGTDGNDTVTNIETLRLTTEI